MKPPSFKFRKLLGIVLSGALLATQSLFAYQPEKNFWSERRRAAQRSPSVVLASLPQQSFGAESLASQFPSPQILRSSLTPSVVRSVPKTFLTGHADLLAALSPAHGSVRKVSPGKNAAPRGPLVIHIQDVHMNAEAQRNIRETVATLLKSGKVGLVALEGSTEDIALQPFVDFPNRKAVELTADYLLKENKISGPIHAAMTAQGKLPRILGIDDPVHYAANVQAYKDSAPKLDETRRLIKAHQLKIDEQKKTVFSPALLALDETVSGYRADSVSLGDYVGVLVEIVSRKENNDSRHSGMGLAGTHASSFRNVDKLMQALNTERSLDFKQVEAERSRLIEKLTNSLNTEEINELMAQSVAYRTGELRYGDFYAELRETCRKKEIPLSDYPAMDEYVRYVLLCDGIDAEKLLNEMVSLEKAAYDTLAATSEEKALAAQSRQAWLTSKLVDFGLTPPEWKEYEGGKGNLEDFPSPLANDGALASFESFYREAEARDTAMAQNLLSTLNNQPRSDSHPTPIALLVTGGFHAEGMANQLTEKGATVISYVPKIEKIDVNQGSAYLSVFTQEKSPLEKLFEGKKLFLAFEPFSKTNQFKAMLWTKARHLWLEKSAMTAESLKETSQGRLMDARGRYRNFRLSIRTGEIVVYFEGNQSVLIDQAGQYQERPVQNYAWTKPLREIPETLALLVSQYSFDRFIGRHGVQDPAHLAKLVAGIQWIKRTTWVGLLLTLAVCFWVGAWGVILLPIFHLLPHYAHNVLFPESPLMTKVDGTRRRMLNVSQESTDRPWATAKGIGISLSGFIEWIRLQRRPLEALKIEPPVQSGENVDKTILSKWIKKFGQHLEDLGIAFGSKKRPLGKSTNGPNFHDLATSLWGVKLAEKLFGTTFGKERVGQWYKALAPVVGVVAALVFMFAGGALASGVAGPSSVEVVSPLLGAVFGVVFVAAHSLMPNSWMPQSLSRKEISFPKVLIQSTAYGLSIFASLGGWGGPEIEVILWASSFLLHAVFDGWARWIVSVGSSLNRQNRNNLRFREGFVSLGVALTMGAFYYVLGTYYSELFGHLSRLTTFSIIMGTGVINGITTWWLVNRWQTGSGLEPVSFWPVFLTQLIFFGPLFGFVGNEALRLIPGFAGIAPHWMQALVGQFIVAPFVFDPLSYVVMRRFVFGETNGDLFKGLKKNMLPYVVLNAIIWAPIATFGLSFPNNAATNIVASVGGIFAGAIGMLFVLRERLPWLNLDGNNIDQIRFPPFRSFARLLSWFFDQPWIPNYLLSLTALGYGAMVGLIVFSVFPFSTAGYLTAAMVSLVLFVLLNSNRVLNFIVYGTQGDVLSKSTNSGRVAARRRLTNMAQPFVDFLSEADHGRPDVFVVSGSNDLKTYVEFARTWKNLGRNIPVVVAGGRGSGTIGLIRKCLVSYGERLTADQTNLLEEALGSASSTTERDILLKVVFPQEGISDSDGNWFHEETRPSSNTEANMRNVAETVKSVLADKPNPSIALVNTPILLLRQSLNATQIWNNDDQRNWRILRYPTYTPILAEMDDNDLLETLFRLVGSPDPSQWDSTFKGELNGVRPGARAIPVSVNIDFSHWENVIGRTLPLFKAYVQMRDVQWDPNLKLLVVPNPEFGKTTGRATSLWMTKLFEWLGSLGGDKNRAVRWGAHYKAHAPFYEWSLGIAVAVVNLGGTTGTFALVLGLLAGALFMASHFMPDSMKPVTQVNIGVGKVIVMGVLYGILIVATPFLLGVDSPNMGVEALAALWGLAGSLHFSFDKENLRKEGEQAAGELVAQLSGVRGAFETMMPGIQQGHTGQIVGKGSASFDPMTEILSRLKTDQEFRAGFVDAVQASIGDQKVSGERSASLKLLSSMVMAATGQPIAHVHVLGNSPDQELQTLQGLIEREKKTPSGFSVALVVSESQRIEFKTLIDVFEARGVAVFRVDLRGHGWSKEALMELDNKMANFLGKSNGILATVGENVGINPTAVEALNPDSKLRAALMNALTLGEVAERWLRFLRVLASNA